MHFHLCHWGHLWSVNGRQIRWHFHGLNFGSSPRWELNGWSGCGRAVESARPTTGSQAPPQPPWKPADEPEPRASRRKGRPAGPRARRRPGKSPPAATTQRAPSQVPHPTPLPWGPSGQHTRPAGPAPPTQPNVPPRARTPAPSRWRVPAAARRRLQSPPTSSTPRRAARGGEGAGRQALPAVRGDAHADLPLPGLLTPAVGGRARRVTPPEEARCPFPALAARAQREPPVRLCGGLLDYVCPLRAAALAAGWRWGGQKTRRRRRRGSGGESARTWLLTPVRNVSD